jgi:hypothetical protein
MMKALSIRQPWAWLICKGYKDIENRDWPTKFRGRIYIHASLNPRKFNPSGEEGMIKLLNHGQRDEYYSSTKHRGAIIGEVDIIDCVERSHSPWFVGKYGFVLENPVLYPSSILCKGKLRFFEPDIE